MATRRTVLYCAIRSLVAAGISCCCCRLAIIVEGAIESWPDFGILLGIQLMNASLSYYETTKAGDAVAALKVGSHTIGSRPLQQLLAKASMRRVGRSRD